MTAMAKQRRIGMHMRTGRGLDKTVETIKALQIGTVQIFTGNPSAWRSAPVDAQATATFKRALEELDVQPAMSHAMYLINLASPNPNFQKKSREALRAELERAEAYGCQYVVTHVGSHMGDGAQAGSHSSGHRGRQNSALGQHRHLLISACSISQISDAD